MNIREKSRTKPISKVIAFIFCIIMSVSVVFPASASSVMTAVAGKTESLLTAVYAYSEYDISLSNAVCISDKNDAKVILTDRKYCDGKVQTAGTLPDGWVVFEASNKSSSYTVTVTIDLGYVAQAVSRFYLRAYKNTSVNADMPTSVKFYVSEDGSAYTYAGTGTTMTNLSGSTAAAVYGYTSSSGFKARYVKTVLSCNGANRLYLNEVGAAEESSLFRANYSYNNVLRDEQGLVYEITDGKATVVDSLNGSYKVSGKLTPSSASFDEDGLVYTLGKGSDNEVTVTSDFIGEGRPNYSGVPNHVKYIVIHNTGTVAEDTDAQRYNYRMHTLTDESGWHYTVDDTEIYHSLADSVVGWHSGSKHNYESIGIEMCVNGAPTDSSGNFIFSGTAYNNWVNSRFRQTVKNTAMLTAELLTRYGLGTDAVIQHNDVTGKNCPMWMRYKNGSFVHDGTLWVEFMEYVEEYYKLFNGPSMNTAFTASRTSSYPIT